MNAPNRKISEIKNILSILAFPESMSTQNESIRTEIAISVPDSTDISEIKKQPEVNQYKVVVMPGPSKRETSLALDPMKDSKRSPKRAGNKSIIILLNRCYLHAYLVIDCYIKIFYYCM